MTNEARVSGPAMTVTSRFEPSRRLRALADKTPERPALVLNGVALSYAHLNRLSDAFAHAMGALGLKPGDRIAYVGRNSLSFIVSLVGALRGGFVIAPLNWRCAVPELRFMLDDSAPGVILSDTEFSEVMKVASAAGRPIIITDDEGPEGLSAMLARAPAGDTAEGDPRGPWLMLYTSGTTGKPKGVLLSQFAIAAGRQAEEDCGQFADWTEDEVLMSPLPLFHVGGIDWAVCGLVRNATIVFTHDMTPAGLLDCVLANKVTRVFMVPTLVRALIEEMQKRGLEATTLKAIQYGAAPMDAALLQRSLDKLGCRFLQYFGMTEMAGSICILGNDEHDLSRSHLLRSVGKVLPGTTIEIRDPEGRVVDVDTAGEIWVKGDAQMLGYANRPEAMAEAVKDGWYRTGDGGRLDAEGFLYLTDRIKDMVVTGGENVYPVEVESVLRDHPAVQDVAVFGLPDARWGEAVTAAVELRPKASVTAEELIAFARQSLAGYKIPRRFEFGVTLPRTASGKVQRGKIRQQFMQ